MKVALDIDDVLAGFYPGMCKFSNREEVKTNIWDGKNLCSWISDDVAKVVDDPSFWLHLPILSRPESINFEVSCYITSSPQSLLSTRLEWLYINKFPDAPIYHALDKFVLMEEYNIDILVDDRIKTIDNINNKGKVGLQFKPSYMTEDISDKSKIITHLSEVGKYIKDKGYGNIS